MYIGRLKSNFASILAFGHMRGMNGNGRRHEPRVKAKTVYIQELTMTAEDMGITFESSPELFRAIHPIFDCRNPREMPGTDGGGPSTLYNS